MSFLCCCFRCESDGDDVDLKKNLNSLEPDHEEEKHEEERKVRTFEKDVYTAHYAYSSEDRKDLDFEVGDRIKVVEDDPATEWRMGFNERTQLWGLVPMNYIAKDIEAETWYHHNASYLEAEIRLKWEGNAKGSFLVRPRKALESTDVIAENSGAIYALSVRTSDLNPEVMHYRIFVDEGKYYISANYDFPSLQMLIKDYLAKDSEKELGLCTRLTKPCPRKEPTLFDIVMSWNIPRKEIILNATPLAAGNFGEVYKGRWRDEDVAVKKLKDHKFNRDDFLKEVKAMKLLKHRNIIRFYGVCLEDEPYWIVVEYMECGNLLEYVKKNQLSAAQRFYVALQICKGMVYLEELKIVHRDLAARNILMNPQLTAKITDFGLSRFLSDNQYYQMLDTSTSQLALLWLAPECFRDKQFGSKTDVWSYAILLMEMYRNGEQPFKELTDKLHRDVVYLQIRQGYKMRKPDDVPDYMYDIMEDCWDLEPKNRPSFGQLNDRFELHMDKYESLHLPAHRPV